MGAQNSVYRSRDQLEFGINRDEKYLVYRLTVDTPYVIEYNGDYHVAYLLPELNSICIVRLK
jgi:hypothetical protein